MSEEQVERRSARCLTEEDLQAIIDRLECRSCKFSPEQAETLRSLSTNMNNSQRIATKIIMVGVIGTVLSVIGGGVVIGIKNAIAIALATATIPIK